MRFWWLTEFKFKINDRKYMKTEFTYFFILLLLTLILWPSKTLDVNKYYIPDLFLIFSLSHFFFITYLSSLISSGNLLAEKEFKTLSLVRYSDFSIVNILLGRFLSTLLYILYLFIILFPFNLIISFTGSTNKILILYLLILIDSIPLIGLGLLWSTLINPALNWFSHWISYLAFIIIPFIFPSTFFFFPLNNILWLVGAENVLYVSVNFNPSKHLPVIILFYLLIFLISILIAQKRLKYYRGEKNK
ncbi:hypothetical protein [Dictyoglomus thermophilum]|uniref:Membrane protein, putative n=1 Tax=Dictyoglomus thermophilum (strain ATCC 35947 / DSM 3960 / H-6-12) TaxID=309799 RepID=B5YCA9_DICT6|nr:hypothetical protein [Dictyoglomus thermophilum]ACI20013.1 membrane protein, putative [Dictyoglomus thermophilum H-6-12]MCX7720820.1 hypothetical protein [Dictyoglomus thermophilum]TYT24064.1 hypothetical protein FY122_00530 [Dictyoglomus thermophilum]